LGREKKLDKMHRKKEGWRQGERAEFRAVQDHPGLRGAFGRGKRPKKLKKKRGCEARFQTGIRKEGGFESRGTVTGKGKRGES